MRLKFNTMSILRIGIVLGLACAPCRNLPGQTAVEPVNLASEITANPTRTIRGSNFTVTVRNPPVNAKDIVVAFDGRPMKYAPKAAGTFEVTVPDTLDASSPEFVSLGHHRVTVMFDKQWYSGDTVVTVVRPEQTTPTLTGATPIEFTRNRTNRRLVLTGSNFATRPAEDNQITLDGSVMPVVWDQCDQPNDWAKDKKSAAHGAVAAGGGTITLCNFALPSKTDVEIGIRQGSFDSGVQILRVPPWSTKAIVIMSLLVNLLSAALVVFLASFVRKYFIGGSHYGMFRILFLDQETNTYSLSKYQFYMWTGAAVFTYSYLAISEMYVQGLSMPDVPSTLPSIIGIGAGTAIGAQLVTNIRGPKGGGQEKPSLGDFVASGGVVAPERVQMFVWTTLGVVAFCLATLRATPWQIKELPQIGDGLMYLMGLSSAGYLGGKLARKPGPVLSEISINPSWAEDSKPSAASGTSSASSSTGADLSQPVAAAQQVLHETQAAAAAQSGTNSPIAFSAAQDALKALRTAIAAATAPGKDTLSTLADCATAADAGSKVSAAEFTRLLSAAPDAQPPGHAALDDSGQLAEIAQRCAAATQDLSSGVAQAIGSAQSVAAVDTGTNPASRTINLRGRNLSTNATFEINGMELPFRMLTPVNGVKAPERVAPEEDPSIANMARELRLTIAPATLGKADKANYDTWFDTTRQILQLGITNPDGQRSEISFTIPPGASQART